MKDYAMPTGLTADELEKAIVREKALSDALTDWPDPDNYIEDEDETTTLGSWGKTGEEP